MKTPVKEVQRRRDELRKRMRRERVGAVVLVGEASVRYWSGFTGSESVLVLTPSTATLYTDGRYVEEAEATSRETAVALWRGHPMAEAGERIKRLGVKRAWFEEDVLRVGWYERLREKTRQVRLSGCSSILAGIRAAKSRWEVQRIEAALRLAEEAFRQTRSLVRPGMTEAEVALELDHRVRVAGAESSSFPTIVAAGANASRPHAQPGRRRIKEGGMVLIDWGVRLNGYCSDLTRTLWIGRIPPLWRERYEVVLQAQKAGLAELSSRRSGAQADAAARAVIAEAGLAERFAHSLGHGVGLEVHEAPRLSRLWTNPLAEGSVVTIEPGIYLPGDGGLRIEDMACVGVDGARLLSSLDRSLASAVV
jgi:Xaa-Pro aminopeptidase